MNRSLEIAENIKKTLIQKNWSFEKFANEMNKTQSEISILLSGKYNFSIRTIIKIETILDIELIFF
jgi:transcriptional regulator with XRE-family HTH domain